MGIHKLAAESSRMTESKQSQAVEISRRQNPSVVGGLHPSWLALIRYCHEMGFGEISQLKIQDGLPVMAEETRKKVKFI